tara:strand:+ start:17154 stop:17678 length:525 start_codon:yes stop_codon:yes gene_type:complete
MTISVKILNDKITEVSKSNTLLDMLMEFEKTLDELDMYAFKNWDRGEVLEGPTLGRHYVNVKLIYPHKEMPDPDGAKRLIARDCLVKYDKDMLESPRRVKDFNDVEVGTRPDGSQRFTPKADSEPVWIVSIDMPRRYVDEFSAQHVEAKEDEFIDSEETDSNAQVNQEQMNMGL